MSKLPIIKYFFPDANEDLNNLPYDLRYAKIGIQKIIRDLHKIERGIVDDIFLTCIRFLEQKKAKIKGDSFVINEDQFKLYVEFVKSERKLIVRFLPIINITYTPIKETIAINSFGAIKTLEIDYPYKIRKNFSKLIEIIKDQITFAYLSLQKVFKTNFRSFGDYFFNELYDIVNIEIERQNKTKLRSNIHFTICIRSNMMFRYFLDHENLELIIEYFKMNQSLEYSPLEMLTSVISEEAIHTLNTLIEVNEGSFYHIDSSEYASQEQNVKFWASESLLIGNEELSTFPILKTDKYIVELGCPKKLETECDPIFKLTKSSLANKIKDNLKSYIAHAKELTKIPKPKLTTPLRLKLAEWLGTFTGNTLYEFFKEAGH